MSPLDAIAVAEWATLAMGARAVFGRAADPTDVREFRLSVRHATEAMPGLSVVEWEFVSPAGVSVAGGEL